MKCLRLGLTAVALLGAAGSATAQQATGTSGSAAATAAPSVVATTTIDVTQLPIDLRRIEQRFRTPEVRDERTGLNLKYYIDVYGKAPNIVLFTKEDNLEHGPAPYGGPTHREMMEVVTPPQFRNHGGINLLNPKAKK